MSESASALFSIADAGEFRFARFYIVCEEMPLGTPESPPCRLGLIVKTEDSSRNRVHYRLNEEAYERLVRIVTTTRNIDRLIAFFDLHCFKLGKDILSLTDEEIDTLLR